MTNYGLIDYITTGWIDQLQPAEGGQITLILFLMSNVAFPFPVW